jgi:hypothetical protein
MLCWREAGAGGEGNARSARAVDFKQGTCEYGISNKRLPVQVRKFSFLANMYPLEFMYMSAE